jgi:hypothetical protein
MDTTPGSSGKSTTGSARGGRSTVVSVAAYAVLFVLGAVQGVFGSFQYSRMSPVMAIGLCVVLLATCLLAAWGMRSVSGAFVPALGWILATYILAVKHANGSVIITQTTAGEWYLYGGTISVVAALVISFGAPALRQRV